MLVFWCHLRQQVFEAFGRRFDDQPTPLNAQLQTLADLHTGVFQRQGRDANGGAVSPLLNFNAHGSLPRKVETL
jgi:hypothetical protein